ncbi:uncharacterized protein J4E84_007222 [Alternaria hordeiaustralica]|uniref:uncharacterized protein n=1 Tax=Alternaria hordeiaustralica TaxID=1187925 RepID=UPI0020C1FA43|nr:uncharacterized protein J4E84_007222 [Alternaria hordeiaustralica]KAI4682758.1 hypothetical protein J4E84_007222 [Alternaria hordeiaustralica]
MKPSSRLTLLLSLSAWTGTVLADDTISGTKIKVQLFAAPSFLSEVSVDAGDENMDQFLSISDGANNLGSVGWGTKIHGLKCSNKEHEDD